MSFLHRPRVIVNGVQRMRARPYYWCQRCERSVSIAFTYPYEASCPHCLGRLHQELGLYRPMFLANVSRVDPNLLDSLAEMLENTNFDWTLLRESENGDRHNRRAGILLQFLPRIASSRENLTPTVSISREIPDDNETERSRALPTSVSSIEAMEKVRVTQTHLANDSQCPVCKDEFVIGVEVKIMPCKHFYHSECIDPWLRLHNTCPVCRYELPVSPDNEVQENDIENFHFDDLMGGMSWTWDRLFSMWPFRLFTNRGYNDLSFEEPDMSNTNEVNPWWRSWLMF